jgi:hypothetical protein
VETIPLDARQDDPRPPYPWLKPVGFVVGVALLGAAVWAAWGQREAVTQGLRSAAGARWWLIALMLGLPLLNWVLSSALFMLLMQPGLRAARRRVRFVEMLWLIGASWLLNYLPMAPGLLGRVAYHRRVHGIPVRLSVQAIGAGLMISVAALGLPLLMAVVFPGLFPTPGGMLAPMLILAGVFLVFGLVDRARGKEHWWMALALCVRSVDIAVWTARYAVVMAVLGLDWTVAGAAAVAVVSQVAVLVPLVGNGLGLREWAVGLVGPVLPTWFRGAAGMAQGVGLAVDLVNRACEVVVAVPVGLLSVLALARGLRRAGDPD